MTTITPERRAIWRKRSMNQFCANDVLCLLNALESAEKQTTTLRHSYSKLDMDLGIAQERAEAAETRAEKAEAERDEANHICILLAGRLQASFSFCPFGKPCAEQTTHFDCVKCICDWAAEATKGGE